MHAIDTNILVHAFDTSEEKKRAIAKQLLQDTFSGRKTLLITHQTLAEAVLVLTKKVRKPLTKEEAEKILLSITLSEQWKLSHYTTNTIRKAIHTKAPFWDALLAQTLIENGAHTLYTENEKDFKEIEGLKTINPYKNA